MSRARVVIAALVALSLPGVSAAGPPSVAVRAHNVDILMSDTVSAHLIDLTAELGPRSGYQRVDLEDADSFAITITAGCARLSADQLTRLFNDRILDYAPRALNDVHFVPERDAMQVTGGVRLWHRVPPFWLSFRATTDAHVTDDGLIRLTVRDEHVLGLPVGGLLNLAHTPLSGLLSLDGPGTRVTGDTVVIDAQKVLPGPAVTNRPVSASLSSAGLTVCFAGDPAETRPALPTDLATDLAAPTSYLWVEGPELAALGQTIAPARLLVTDEREDSAPMRFRLVKSRGQIAAEQIRLDARGRMTIVPGPAEPPAVDSAGD